MEIEVDATQEEIKAAYRKLLLIHHPDKNGTKENFNKLKTSYSILSNPVLRDIFDNHGFDGLDDYKLFNELDENFYASEKNNE